MPPPPRIATELVNRSFIKQLDKMWRWEAYVFSTPTSILARYAIRGLASFPNQRDAKRDMQKVLNSIGLGKAPAAGRLV